MLFQSYYFPCIAFFSKCVPKKEIKIYSNDQYSKQSYRTRTYILGANKVEGLSIPVHKAKLTRDIEIDYKENWQRDHWRTIQAAYNKSPFFEFYDYLFEPLFNSKNKFLIDHNNKCLSVCLKALQLDMPIWQTKTDELYEKQDVFHLNAKKRDENLSFFIKNTYNQNFGLSFESNLSIIDLIFNKGPESLQLINNSHKTL